MIDAWKVIQLNWIFCFSSSSLAFLLNSFNNSFFLKLFFFLMKRNTTQRTAQFYVGEANDSFRKALIETFKKYIKHSFLLFRTWKMMQNSLLAWKRIPWLHILKIIIIIKPENLFFPFAIFLLRYNLNARLRNK